MIDEKLTKIKRLIARLDYPQIVQLEKYFHKKKDESWRKERAKRRTEHIEKIRALPVGTEVVSTNTSFELSGKIGKIVRHLGRGSTRTVVDFGDKGTWRVPSQYLSADVSDEYIKRLKGSKIVVKALNSALSKIQL